ncbi:MAG: M56 family metallopeptidase, partial [Kaistella sp.]
METFFLYLAKVILTSGVMFGYYRLFLKDKTFHHYNRFYLLAVLVISLLLPLLSVDYFTIEVNSGIYLLINQLQYFNEAKTLNHDF